MFRDALLNGLKLRRSYFIRAVRHIQQYAFKFIQRADDRFVAALQRCLPVQPVLFH